MNTSTMETQQQITPRGKVHLPMIKPKALSAFLRLALGDGVDAAGLVETKSGRILGWEDVDEARAKSDIGWLVVSVVTEGVSMLKGHRIASINLLQARLTLVLVSFQATVSAQVLTAKIEEMKRVLEVQHQSAIAGIPGGPANNEKNHKDDDA